MKWVNRLFLFVVCIFILSSCATIAPQRTANRSESREWTLEYTEYVNISTEPVKAKIYVNDTYVGISPLKVPLPSVPLKISQSGAYQVEWKDGDFGFTSHERSAKRSSATTWSERTSGSIQSYSFKIQAFQDGYQPASKLVSLSKSSPSILKAINNLEPSNDGKLQSTVYGYRNVLVVLYHLSESNRGANAPMPLQKQTNTGHSNSEACRSAIQDYNRAQAAYNNAMASRDRSDNESVASSLGAMGGSKAAPLLGLFAGATRRSADTAQQDMNHALIQMQDAKRRMSIHCGN